jgi:hypothetical protein
LWRAKSDGPFRRELGSTSLGRHLRIRDRRWKGECRVKAYILIQAEPGTDGKLAREVAEVDGVGRVERVTGPYDLIAEAEWSQGRMHAVLARIQGLEGVLRVLTSLVLDGSRATAPMIGMAREAARGA